MIQQLPEQFDRMDIHRRFLIFSIRSAASVEKHADENDRQRAQTEADVPAVHIADLGPFVNRRKDKPERC